MTQAYVLYRKSCKLLKKKLNVDFKICLFPRLNESNMLKISHLKHLLLFEICACEISEKFVYKHSETIEYVNCICK